jgi:hypothetical protein
MREIVHGPCQLIFASSRFFITPSSMDVTPIHRATHADILYTYITFAQARICFISYYGRFFISRFTESSFTSGEEGGRSLAAQSIYH